MPPAPMSLILGDERSAVEEGGIGGIYYAVRPGFTIGKSPLQLVEARQDMHPGIINIHDIYAVLRKDLIYLKFNMLRLPPSFRHFWSLPVLF